MTQAPRKLRGREALAQEQMLRDDAQTLNDVALELTSELDLQALVQKVTDAGTRLTEAKFGAFFYNMIDEKGEAYQLYTLSGAPREAFSKFGMPRNTPVFAKTFSGQGVVRVDDITKDPRYGQMGPHHGMPKGHLPVRSYLAVPVIARSGEVLGGLFFGHPDEAVFTERAERLARGIAAQAAIAIDNAQLYAKARREIEERTRTEAALLERERQIRHLLGLMPAAMYAVDERGCITHFNRRAAELWGREPRLGDEDQKFCGSYRLWRGDGTPLPHDQAPVADALRRGTSVRDMEVVIERPDGRRVPVSISVDPITDEQGKTIGAINVFQDITERKRADEAVRATQRRYAQLVHSLPAAVYTCDAAGRIQLYNDAAVRLWGQSPVIGRDAWCGSLRIFRPTGEPLPLDECPMAVALRENRAVRGEEIVIERPDGTRRHVLPHPEPIHDEEGRLVGAINMLVDITDRKLAEEARAHLAAIVASSGDAIVSKTLDGVITSWNEAAERMFGYTAREVIGKCITLLIPSERIDEESQIIGRISRGERVEHFETVRVAKDGRRLDVSLTVSPVLNAAGEVIGASKVARDITDRKRSEEALRDSERRLRMALTAGGMGTWEWELESGQVHWSRGLEEIRGRKPRSHKAGVDDMPDDLHPDDRERVRAAIRRAVETRSDYRLEYRVLLPEGEVRWLETRGTLIDEPGRTPRFAGVTMDITDRKASEQQLRQSHDTFLNLIEAAPFGVYLVDSQFRLAQASAGSQKVFANVDPLIGRDFAEVMRTIWPEPFAAEAIAIFRHTLETGEPYRSADFSETRADIDEVESYDWQLERVTLSDGRFGVVCYFYDITERRRAELALRDSEHRFRTLAETAQVGIVVSDADGECVFANRAWSEMSGLTVEKARGGWARAVHPDDRARIVDGWHASMLNHQSFDFEFRFLKPDGAIVWVEGSAVELTDPDGRRTGYLATLTDITARRDAVALLEGSIDALTSHIAILDRRGVIIKVNQAWRQFADGNGFQRGGFGVGCNYLDACRWRDAHIDCDLHADDAAQGIRDVIDGRRQGLVLEYPCHSPTEHRWFIMRVTRFGEGEDLRVVVSHEDVTQRHEDEQTIRDSEEKFRNLADHMAQFAWMTDEIGYIHWYNRRWFEYTGTTLEDMQGWGWQKVQHPDHVDRVTTKFKTALEAGEPWEDTFPLRGRDGEYRWFLSRANPIRDKDGRIVRWFGTNTDITSQRQTEAALRETQERFARFMQHLSGLAWIKDHDGRYVYVNDAAERAFGKSRDELYGKRDEEVFPPHVAEQFTKHDRQALRLGKGIEVVETLEQDDGTHYSLVSKFPIPDPDGRPALVGGMAIDITDRLRAEQALRQSEEQFRRAIEDAPIPVIMQTEDGEVLQISRAWTALTGYTVEDAPLFQTWLTHAYGIDNAQVRDAVHDQFTNDSDIREREFQITTRSGENRVWVFSASSPGSLRDGRRFVVAMAQDITERNRTELALRDSESRFRTLTMNAPTAIFIKDVDGRYTLANALACSALAREDVTGLTDHDLMPAPVADLLRANDLKVMQTGQPQELEEIVEAQGVVRDFLAVKFPLRDADGRTTGVCGVAVDITERKRAQRALRDSEERFRQVTESLPQLVWTCLPDGPCDYLSPQWVNYTGIPEAPQLGFGWLDEVHPDDRPRVIEHWKTTAAACSDFRIEFRIRRHDGEYRWFRTLAVPLLDKSGRIVKWFGSNTDIQDSKQSEQDLRESEERFRVMANHAPVMVWVAGSDGACTFLSKSWCQFTGQEEAAGLGWGWLEAVHRDDRRAARDAFERALSHRKPFRVEYRLRRHDGEYRWAINAAAPRLDADGNYVGYIGSVIDITERKHAEQELRRAKNELELRVAERTAELRALTQELTQTERRERKRLAQVLHDEIQQLLAAVKMQADFALLSPGSSDAIQRVKHLADDAIAACRTMTVGLSPPVLRDADLAAALHWLSRHMLEQHGLTVQIYAQDPDADLQEDLRVLLFEITRELLFNVVKHSGVDRADVSYVKTNGDICIEVADEGNGCAPDALSRPGRDSFGLFSIRERLGALGGVLETDTSPKKGVRVRVRVPVSACHPGPSSEGTPPEPAPAGEASPRTGSLRVLLADDHQILRQGLAELLSTQPDLHVVAQASDGVEAVELARQYLPDVIVMDITMPRMSGVEATRVIHNEMPQVRVIGLSMHDRQDMAAAMRDAGAEAFLNKAGPVEQLLAALRGHHE